MIQTLFLCLYFPVCWLPCFLANPFRENASQLAHTHLFAYWVWILFVVWMLVALGRKCLRPVYCLVPAALLVVAGLVTYSPSNPGWVNDIHIWSQVLALVLYALGWVRCWFFRLEPVCLPVFLSYCAGFVLLCMCGCVSGLSESVFATGLGLSFLYAKKRHLL